MWTLSFSVEFVNMSISLTLDCRPFGLISLTPDCRQFGLISLTLDCRLFGLNYQTCSELLDKISARVDGLREPGKDNPHKLVVARLPGVLLFYH